MYLIEAKQKVVVTHDNFDELYEELKKGKVTFYVPTHSRITVIDKKVYDKFNKINREVLMKDKSGSGLGFRMASGRSSIFLFPNQLIAVYN